MLTSKLIGPYVLCISILMEFTSKIGFFSVFKLNVFKLNFSRPFRWVSIKRCSWEVDFSQTSSTPIALDPHVFSLADTDVC